MRICPFEHVMFMSTSFRLLLVLSVVGVSILYSYLQLLMAFVTKKDSGVKTVVKECRDTGMMARVLTASRFCDIACYRCFSFGCDNLRP